MANGAAIGAAACTCCTCLFAFVALGLPVWMYATISTPVAQGITVDQHAITGLWQSCSFTSADSDSISFSNCENIETTDCGEDPGNVCTKINAVRAFSTMTLLALCVTLVGTILMITGQSMGWVVAAGSAVGASFCSMVAFAIYAALYNSDTIKTVRTLIPYNLSIGFALQVCVFIFSLICAGLAFAGMGGGGNGSV